MSLAIATRAGIGGSTVSALFNGISTSMQEPVATVAALRRGVLTLVIGGNFDSVAVLVATGAG